MVDQVATVVRLLLMGVGLVATAVEVTEEAMETHPDQEANPPGGKHIPVHQQLPLGFETRRCRKRETFARLTGNFGLFR